MTLPTLHYESPEVISPDRLSSDEIGAIRLGAWYWLVATALLGSVSCYLALSIPGYLWSAGLRSLHQPNIIGVTMLLQYWSATPIETTLRLVSALGWVASCWLISDLAAPRFSATARWLRVMAVVVLAFGVIFGVIGWSWEDSLRGLLIVNADVVLALVVALHLRWMARLLPSAALTWIAQKLPWIVGADLLMTALAHASAPEVSERMYLAVEAVVATYSALLITAMIILARLKAAPKEPAPLSPPPA